MQRIGLLSNQIHCITRMSEHRNQAQPNTRIKNGAISSFTDGPAYRIAIVWLGK
jgi:hypothetical protein